MATKETAPEKSQGDAQIATVVEAIYELEKEKYRDQPQGKDLDNRLKVQAGLRLRLVRLAYGMSMAAFADTLGIPRARLNFYELGERSIPLSLLANLHQKAHVPADFILFGDATPRALPSSLMERISQVDEGLERVLLIQAPRPGDLTPVEVDVVTDKLRLLGDMLDDARREVEELCAGLKVDGKNR